MFAPAPASAARGSAAPDAAVPARPAATHAAPHAAPAPSVALPLATLVLAALALGTTWAHVLELPQKLRLDPAAYAAVNGALYRWFALAGAPVSLAAIACAAALAWTTRRDPHARRWTVAGAVLLALWLASWVLLVQPVNAQVADALRTAPAGVPALWQELRGRWEGGHADGFALELAGFVALAVGALRRSPPAAPGHALGTAGPR